jgi:short-chain fatty acids transporter
MGLIDLQRATKTFNGKVAFFTPHSFLLAIFITFITYFLGIFWAYQGPFDMIQFWFNGFWNFLAFSMQMVLMVVAGLSIVSVPLGQKILRTLAAIPKTPRGGIVFITVIISLFSWMHWGIGLVAGAFLAREMGRRIQNMDYPLLVACAYIGMAAGTFGLFAFEPQTVSRSGHFLEPATGVISLAQTSLSPAALSGFFLGTIGIVIWVGLICPPREKADPPDAEILKRFEWEDRAEEISILTEREMRKKGGMSFGVWLEHSRWPVWLISIMSFAFIVFWFYTRGLNLNLNILNFVLFFLALSLHDTPMRFLQSIERSVKAAYGIVVQFPFYAGIQGMLTSSGLAALFFGWITSWATPMTFPIWAYLNAAILNLFVPSPEGLWEIQGPLVVKAAQTLQISIPRAINAFTAGETIGNVIQPFWALPLLGICGLSMRHIMGYCLMSFVILSMVWILCVTFLPV